MTVRILRKNSKLLQEALGKIGDHEHLTYIEGREAFAKINYGRDTIHEIELLFYNHDTETYEAYQMSVDRGELHAI